MESAEQPTKDLLTRVGRHLNKEPQSLNPNDESPLEVIKRDVGHIIDSTIEERIGGADNSVNDRGAKGKIATLITRIRGMKKAA